MHPYTCKTDPNKKIFNPSGKNYAARGETVHHNTGICLHTQVYPYQSDCKITISKQTEHSEGLAMKHTMQILSSQSKPLNCSSKSDVCVVVWPDLYNDEPLSIISQSSLAGLLCRKQVKESSTSVDSSPAPRKCSWRFSLSERSTLWLTCSYSVGALPTWVACMCKHRGWHM